MIVALAKKLIFYPKEAGCQLQVTKVIIRLRCIPNPVPGVHAGYKRLGRSRRGGPVIRIHKFHCWFTRMSPLPSCRLTTKPGKKPQREFRPIRICVKRHVKRNRPINVEKYQREKPESSSNKTLTWKPTTIFYPPTSFYHLE